MKRESILYGIIGILVGSLLTFWLVSLRQDVGTPSMASSLDKHFIEQMIPHHEGAVEMAKLAQERSKHPEILTLAKVIIQSQTQEITQMRTWYKNWYKVEVPVNVNAGMGMGRGMMHGGMMGGKTANFDEAFLQEMIPHHQMAVMMAQMLLSGTSRLEMKQLAQDIVTAQEAEITQMRSWLEQTDFPN